MKTIYRDPIIEEGKHNVILQNRCGNRLTLLCMEDNIDLEFVYKPNAYRRKEYEARCFSNRDNQTVLFKKFALPEIKAEYIDSIDYDPFDTKFNILLPNGGTNTLRFINVIDENCFAISAISPLTIAFRPYQGMQGADPVELKVDDGLITTRFIERGEEITTFVAFDGYIHNRYRILDDGTYILQLCENDLILVGGEENLYQVRRLLKKIRPMNLDDLIDYNEEKIKLFLGKAQLRVNNPEFQKVLDLNRRMVFSEVDEGGVTFGALQRIYFLNWFRDTLMSTSMFALTGNPDLIKLSFPYSYNNPSIVKEENGRIIREFLQIIGSRWTKSEDDGLFYVFLGLYSLYKSTGDDSFLYENKLSPLLDAVDFAYESLFDQDKGIFGSDTLGETTLKNSHFFGYDAVNGSIDQYVETFQKEFGDTLAYSYSLYQNMNMYNIFKFAELLIKASPDMSNSDASKYKALSKKLGDNIVKTFKNEKTGYYNPGILVMEDGREILVEDFLEHDKWEYVWSVSLAPFTPDINLALETCRFAKVHWPQISYGYCPWNTMTRFLKEYGMDDQEYEDLLAEESEDALAYTERYPMVGALPEYQKGTEWKGLAFTTGSLMYSLYSLILQSLPMGLAVRASGFVDKVENFCHRDKRVYAESMGQGQVVGEWRLNGKVINGSLQIPEGELRPGRNDITINRTQAFCETRLYSSNAVLMKVAPTGNSYMYEFNTVLDLEMIFENFKGELEITTLDGEKINYEIIEIRDTNKVNVKCDSKSCTGVLVVHKY